MSVLGLDSGYTVKYTHPLSGVPSGFALGNSFRRRGISCPVLSCPNTDTLYHSWVGNIKIKLYHITFKRGIFFTVHSLGSIRIDRVLISIIILNYNILSVSVLDLGYNVKYSPSQSGVPSGFALGSSLRRRLYLTIYPLPCPNADTVYYRNIFRQAVQYNKEKNENWENFEVNSWIHNISGWCMYVVCKLFGKQ